MKIAFNARTLWGPQSRGWSRYTSNLIRSLSKMDLELVLITDRSLNSSLLNGADHSKIEIVQKKGSFYLDWEQRILPQVCENLNVDILHCPINYGLPLRSFCPQVLTLHDVIGEAYNDKNNTLKQKLFPRHIYSQLLHKASLLASDKIITVSEHAKKDILSLKGVAESKVEVIYEGADSVFNQKNIPEDSRFVKRWGIEKPYFFYVGGFDPRKNIDYLFESFSQLKEEALLVIAGGGPEKEQLKKKIKNLGMEERIRLLGWVEDQDLPMLYAHALALVYPSVYEGFGLQIVEAMEMGCPVLCSNQTSLPEVWGCKEGLFDPFDQQSLLGEMKSVIRDPEYRQRLVDWAHKRKQDFSWEKTAQQTYNLYQSL